MNFQPPMAALTIAVLALGCHEQPGQRASTKPAPDASASKSPLVGQTPQLSHLSAKPAAQSRPSPNIGSLTSPQTEKTSATRPQPTTVAGLRYAPKPPARWAITMPNAPAVSTETLTGDGVGPFEMITYDAADPTTRRVYRVIEQRFDPAVRIDLDQHTTAIVALLAQATSASPTEVTRKLGVWPARTATLAGRGPSGPVTIAVCVVALDEHHILQLMVIAAGPPSPALTADAQRYFDSLTHTGIPLAGP